MNLSSGIHKVFLLLFLLSHLQFAGHEIESQNYSYKLLTNNEGLSQNSVSSIVQDKYGFLWFGTEEGLSRYDGYNFINFKKTSQENSISNPFVLKILKDQSGELWIGTDGGLNKFNYDKNNFERFVFSTDYRYLDAGSHSINDIWDKDDNTLLMASDALILFDKKSEIYEKHVISDERKIILNCLVIDKNGQIWIGTDEGLYKFNENSKSNKFQQINSLSINDLFFSQQGQLWIGAKSGLYSFNFNDKSSTRVKISEKEKINIMDIYEDSDNCLWVTTSGDGLYTSCNKKRIFEQFNFENIPHNKNLLSHLLTIFEDRSGVIWIGCDGSGLLKIEKHKNFKTIIAEPSKSNNLNSSRIFGLDKDLDENKIWISTYGGGVNVLNRTSGEVKIIRKEIYPKLISNEIRDIYQLPFNRDIFWIATNEGINVYNKSLDQITETYTAEDGLNHPSIYSIISDEEENIWIASAGGLNKFNYSSKTFDSFTNDPSDSTTISSNSCRLLYMDRNKNLWIGTYGKGLNRFDKETNAFIHYFEKTENDKAPTIVTTLFEDYNNNFWVGTYGSGLIKLNPETGKYIRFTEENGLPNNSIFGILEDDQGHLWISTNFGVSKFDFKNANFHNFFKDDGLQGNEFNDGAFCKLDNGEIFFGGFHGLTYFIPREIITNNIIPQIALTSFKKRDKEFYLGKDINLVNEIELTHKDLIISFEFASLNYLRNEYNKYAYKLEGLSDEWIELGGNRSITFTSLDPGEYYFRVKGSNNDGVWNEVGRSIKIVVTPPFYSTWIFRIIFVVFVVALCVYLYKKRMKNIQFQKEKLRKLVAERTIELENANVSLMKEIEERKKAEEEVTRYIEELQESKDMMEQNAFDLVEINMKIEESEQKLKELNAQKDKFFSIISHDLKSPFVALLGYTEILMEEFGTLSQDEMKEFISSINKASKNVYNLLENLLEWSRIQTGRIDFIPEFFNIAETASIVVDLLSESAKRKNIKLINNTEESGIVYGDENMANTIMRNLVSNAIKFTRENGEVIISSEREIGFLTITVQDNGVGMTEEVLSKLFRIDVHHTTTGTDKEKGTGVGLILCKELVEQNGGEIWVESKLDEGSKFRFTLPIKPAKS